MFDDRKNNLQNKVPKLYCYQMALMWNMEQIFNKQKYRTKMMWSDTGRDKEIQEIGRIK